MLETWFIIYLSLFPVFGVFAWLLSRRYYKSLSPEEQRLYDLAQTARLTNSSHMNASKQTDEGLDDEGLDIVMGGIPGAGPISWGIFPNGHGEEWYEDLN